MFLYYAYAFPGEEIMSNLSNRSVAPMSFAFLTVILLLCATASGQSGSAAHKLPAIPFEEYRLNNGLQVILSEDHTLPLVSVNIWYHVGPANEKAGRTGFAHLFEHMMFEGSQHVGSKAHFSYLEAAGATEINGTTNFDRTNYFETVPSNQLDLALWLESDRMGYLPGKLDIQNLANQRDVVRNERRQSTENTPYGLVEEGLYHLLFPKDHPYYPVVIGSHAEQYIFMCMYFDDYVLLMLREAVHSLVDEAVKVSEIVVYVLDCTRLSKRTKQPCLLTSNTGCTACCSEPRLVLSTAVQRRPCRSCS